MDNLEVNKFLEKCHLLRLNQEERENMNKSIISNEIETVIKKHSNNKCPDQMASQKNYIKHLEKNSHLSFLNFS